MLGQQFYHETMRKVVVAFGTIFNNINIVRKNNSGTIIQKMKVPLAYGPAQKFLTRLDNDPSLKNKVAVTLPRIGFEIANLAYDPVRKLNRVQKFKKTKSSKQGKVRMTGIKTRAQNVRSRRLQVINKPTNRKRGGRI